MTDTQTDARTRITQMATVVVPVSDQDRAIEFFTGRLGFEKRADTPFGNGDRWVEVAPPGATTTIALTLPQPGEAVGIDTHVAFNSEDLDADHAALAERGVDVDPEVMRMGDPVPPMFWLRDPDGNRFLLVEVG